MSQDLRDSLVTALLIILVTGFVSLAVYSFCRWIDTPEWKHKRNGDRQYQPIKKEEHNYIDHQ